MPKALRSAAGYRYYCSADIDNLKFIRRARDLGFSVEQISALLSLWHQREGTHENVKAMALSHLSGLKTKIAELQTMAATLEQLARDCQGNNRPGCPIIAGLVESTSIIEPRSSQTPKFGVSSLTPLRNRSH